MSTLQKSPSFTKAGGQCKLTRVRRESDAASSDCLFMRCSEEGHLKDEGTHKVNIDAESGEIPKKDTGRPCEEGLDL